MREQIKHMLEEAEGKESVDKIAQIEEAILISEQEKAWDLAYLGRTKHVEATIFSGRIELAFDSFSWCLNHYQVNRTKAEVDVRPLLWQYKWVVSKLDSLISLTTQEIEVIFDSMKTLYLEHGISLRPYYQKMCFMLVKRGDMAQAEMWFDRWRRAPVDAFTDCSSCEQNDEAFFYLLTGDLQKAMDLYRPIMRGVMRCEETPHLAFPRLILPLYFKGETKNAQMAHEKSLRLNAHKLEYVGELSYNLLYLRETNPKKALKLIRSHTPLALSTNDLWDAFRFFLSCWATLETLEQKKIFFESETAGGRGMDWYRHRTLELQQEFDYRNKTDAFEKLVKKTFEGSTM